MPQKLNVLYRNAAEEFARRAVFSLGEQVNSVVLFGSVARNRARRESDIDLLVVGAERALQHRIFDIAYEVSEASGFEAFLSVTYLSREELWELVRLNSAFISNVLQEGAILHDDGTFSGIRNTASAASR